MSPKRAKRRARRAAKRGKPRRAKAKTGRATRKSAKLGAKPAAKRPAKPVKAAARAKAAKSAQAARKNAAKRAARKVAKRAAPRPPSAPRRTTLRIVRSKPPKPAANHGPGPFAGAIEGASAKDLAIFDLVRARVELQAAIQGLQGASANTPVAEGKWSPREILLHLYYWDREMLPWIERAWRHDERPPHTKDQILTENDQSLGEIGHHDWDEARRLMQQSREAFLEALQSVPEEPAAMWSSEHALGRLIRILSHHDRHHAAVIKDARGRGASSGTESP